MGEDVFSHIKKRCCLSVKKVDRPGEMAGGYEHFCSFRGCLFLRTPVATHKLSITPVLANLMPLLTLLNGSCTHGVHTHMHTRHINLKEFFEEEKYKDIRKI